VDQTRPRNENFVNDPAGNWCRRLGILCDIKEKCIKKRGRQYMKEGVEKQGGFRRQHRSTVYRPCRKGGRGDSKMRSNKKSLQSETQPGTSSAGPPSQALGGDWGRISIYMCSDFQGDRTSSVVPFSCAQRRGEGERREVGNSVSVCRRVGAYCGLGRDPNWRPRAKEKEGRGRKGRGNPLNSPAGGPTHGYRLGRPVYRAPRRGDGEDKLRGRGGGGGRH